MDSEITIVSYLQATNPAMATQLKSERLAMATLIADLQGRLDKGRQLLAGFQIRFDGGPGPEAGRFIEVENLHGESISIGDWVEDTEDEWILLIPAIEKENE